MYSCDNKVFRSVIDPSRCGNRHRKLLGARAHHITVPKWYLRFMLNVPNVRGGAQCHVKKKT